MNATLNDNTIREVRAELGRRDISRKQFAVMLGTTDMWVYRRLQGNVGLTLDDVERMASVLSVPPARLLGAAA